MNVFLDLDGTLSDPKPGIVRCIAHALDQLGLDCPDADDLDWVIGPPLLDSFARLGARDPHAALDLYRARYQDTGLFENRVYDGVPEALAQLTARGCRLFLATAKPHVYARRITAHFGLAKWFEQEFGPELDGTRNNKADLLAHALQVTGADPARSVMVGDRSHDLAAAAAVGMGAIGVTWGFGGAAELASADRLCGHPRDLVRDVGALIG